MDLVDDLLHVIINNLSIKNKLGFQNVKIRKILGI